MTNTFSVCTLSLGSCEHHSLSDKLLAAKKAGFTELELYWPDWLKHEKSVIQGEFETGDIASIKAANRLKKQCDSLGIRFNALQPLMDFEGCTQQQDREAALHNASAMLVIASALSIPCLMVASRWQARVPITTDLDIIANDLGELADLAAQYQPVIQVAFEAIAWSQTANTWQQAWEVVRKANRPNLGILIDTFNWLAREYADPYASSGLTEHASEVFSSSLAQFQREVPGDKIAFLQIADGKRMIPPLQRKNNGMEPLQYWSRFNRLFPLEEEYGAYLPLVPIVQSILAKGYKGPLSLEVFNASLNESKASVPNDHATRAYQSLEHLKQELQA